MWNDLRFALRSLRNSPMFTAVTVLSIALGIGANTAIFSLLDQVLLRMLPVSGPERLVVLHNAYSAEGLSLSDNSESVFSYPMYEDLRDSSGAAFSGLAARSSFPVTLMEGGNSERGRTEIVSGNLFEVLGVTALLGRTLTAEDDRIPGGHPVVVLTHSYWMRRFGGKPEILNQTIRVNGHPMTIVGVLPKGFRGLLTSEIPDIMAPIAMKREVTPTWDGLNDRRTRWLTVVGRLKPGVSSVQAETTLQAALGPILEEELAQGGAGGSSREEFLAQRLELRPAGKGLSNMRSGWRLPLLVLGAMVILVLLIACANVANLMLTRAAGREREIAVRMSLGAGRSAIVRHLFAESILIAVFGGLAGLLAASWASDMLLGLMPLSRVPGLLLFDLDGRILAFNFAVALLTALLFGMVPAFQSSRTEVSTVLKRQTSAIASGSGQRSLRKALVVGQVALALLLLISAGLFASSLGNLMSVDPGFRPENLATFSIDPRLNGYDAERNRRFYAELEERLRALPGVRAVGAANPGPLSGASRGGSVSVEGYRAGESEYTGASQHSVGPGYFRAMGIPLIAGREFGEKDTLGAPKTAIVNEAFVKRYVDGGNALGKRLAFAVGNSVKLDIEIVGVVSDNKHGSLREEVRQSVFSPYAQDENLSGLSFYIRTGSDENAIASQVRGLVRSMDEALPVHQFRTMEAEVEGSVYADRLVAALSSAFGLLATLLAAIGVYGVIAYSVARRTNEIGVRVALGAMRKDVILLVMKEVALLSIAGITAGAALALAGGRLIESQLYGIKPHDPLILTGAVIALAAVAMLAAFLPARRASRIEPIAALRYD